MNESEGGREREGESEKEEGDSKREEQEEEGGEREGEREGRERGRKMLKTNEGVAFLVFSPRFLFLLSFFFFF